MALSARPSFELRADRGRLLSGYQQAALLYACTLSRITHEVGQQTSTVDALLGWVDGFWISQPARLRVQIGAVEWEWSRFSFTGDLQHGGRITGVAWGEPTVIEM